MLLKVDIDTRTMWCWWCCHPIEGEPLHLPYKYDDRRRKFETYGYYCSWPCMKAYNVRGGGPRYGEIQQNITLMRKMCYGKIEALRMAPHREALQVFGGTMTIEDFRQGKDEPIVHKPFMVFNSCIIKNKDMVQTATTFSSDNQHKLKTIQETNIPSEQLKLKRTKPLKRTESPLEKSLNLKRAR